MSNTSATGGILTPVVPSPPLEDGGLDAVFQQLVVGITELPGNMVRPRWQPIPPKQPEPSVDWCAIGVSVIVPDDGPSIVHDSSALGKDNYVRHEELSVLTSFYGLNALRYAVQLRDGLTMPQNCEGLLRTNGMGYVDSEPIRAVPELVNQQWIKRYDLALRFRRNVARTYQVENIVSAEVAIEADASNGILAADVVVNAV